MLADPHPVVGHDAVEVEDHETGIVREQPARRRPNDRSTDMLEQPLCALPVDFAIDVTGIFGIDDERAYAIAAHRGPFSNDVGTNDVDMAGLPVGLRQLLAWLT